MIELRHVMVELATPSTLDETVQAWGRVGFRCSTHQIIPASPRPLASLVFERTVPAGLFAGAVGPSATSSPGTGIASATSAPAQTTQATIAPDGRAVQRFTKNGQTWEIWPADRAALGEGDRDWSTTPPDRAPATNAPGPASSTRAQGSTAEEITFEQFASRMGWTLEAPPPPPPPPASASPASPASGSDKP